MRISKSAFNIANWDEKEKEDWYGGKLTRTNATKNITGQMEGTAELEAIMLRLSGEQDGVMAYVGVERINCILEGRKGSFILIHTAEAIGQDANAHWKILTGSGTGELKGISGTGDITPGHDFTLTYDLPKV